jgi:tetratricopeptide (TPR) repeat protein
MIRAKKIYGTVLLLVLFILACCAFTYAQKYKECMQLVMSQRWNPALKCVQEFKDERPSWFFPVYLEAKIYRGMNQDANALRSLKEASDLAMGDEELFPIFYEYTHFYYVRWRDASDRQQAEKWCVQAKSVASKRDFQKKAHSICGKISYRQEDWSSAERDLERAYRLDRKNANIAELYIKTLMRRGKERKAITELKRAPKNPNTYGMLAEVYIKSGQFDEAIENAEACLRIDPRMVRCIILQADGYIGKKEWQVAAKSLQRATVLKPKDWLGNKKLGEVYMQTKEFDRAIEYLNKSCNNTPLKECSSFISLAVAYENVFTRKNKQRKYVDSAKVAIDEAAKRCPGNSKMLEVKERIEARIKDLETPTHIEIDCEDPRYRNRPECKELLEEEEN